jgi:fatty acid-binding protein DegV
MTSSAQTARTAGMPRTVVIVDADACVPAALVEALPLRAAPADAPLLLERESVPALSLERAPMDAEPAVAACALAAAYEETEAILYLRVGDGYGGAEEAPDRAHEAVAGRGVDLQVIETGHALMAAGWPAVVAAESIERGGTAAEAIDAATLALRSSRALALIEHPQFPGLAGTQVPDVLTRAVARLEGEAFRLVSMSPRRDQALVALRDHFAALVADEALTQPEAGALRVAVHHAGAGPAADAMARWIERHTDAAQVVVAPLTRHAATRLGPGMVGMAWVHDPAYAR